jgi:hypothetical protein
MIPTPPPKLRSTITFFLLATGLFGWLLLLNSPHEGINASLHWDAEASITHGPNCSKEELAVATVRLPGRRSFHHRPGRDHAILLVVRSTGEEIQHGTVRVPLLLLRGRRLVRALGI